MSLKIKKLCDGETASNYPVVGLIEYLNWKEKYDNSNKSGELAILFCEVFDVGDKGLKKIDNDYTADSLIRSNYCYDDFIVEREEK